MRFAKENTFYLILFIIVGALLGGALGTLLAEIHPALVFLKKNLTGFIGVNLDFIRLEVSLSLSSLLGIVSGIVIFAKA
ncbi:MAG: hypothetical protein JXK07_01540 [Spirochaetes bacterium]|nr:hypothetical protein [Spirochaetota bacterium]MBN2772256.1 hypothetical protein [Spirochaetota bacterium]